MFSIFPHSRVSVFPVDRAKWRCSSVFYKRSHPLFLVIVVLAVIGFISMLINNPMALLTSLVITATVVGFFLLIFHLIAGSRNSLQRQNTNKGSGERRAYMKAAKYSQRKYGKKQPVRKQDKFKRTIRRRNASHLTVIEGKKGKKKDRALH